MKNLFSNENSRKWIKAYKVIVILGCVGILVLGFYWAKTEATNFDRIYGKQIDFIEFLLHFILPAVIAWTELICGMLLANFFENVQIIREKMEDIACSSKSQKTAAESLLEDSPSTEEPSFVCCKCGAAVARGESACKSCGQPFEW